MEETGVQVIIDEIVMEVNKTIDKNKVLEDEYLNEDNTVAIVCTEILEDVVKADDKNETVIETSGPDDQLSFSSYDLFKKVEETAIADCKEIIDEMIKEAAVTVTVDQNEASEDEDMKKDCTVDIVCTEISEDGLKPDDKNETVEEATEATDDLLAYSWFDLFKNAYDSWGRDEQAKTAETSLEEVEERKTDHQDIGQTDNESLKSDENKEFDEDKNVFDDLDTTELSAAEFYQQLQENFDLNNEGEAPVGDDEGISEVKYPQSSKESEESDETKKMPEYDNFFVVSGSSACKGSGQAMTTETSLKEAGVEKGVKMAEYQDLMQSQESWKSEEKLEFDAVADVSNNTGDELSMAEEVHDNSYEDKTPKDDKKSKEGKNRRSARLLEVSGSLVKTEKEEDIKIVLRRSVRLQGKRKKIEQQKDDDETGKKAKKYD